MKTRLLIIIGIVVVLLTIGIVSIMTSTVICFSGIYPPYWYMPESGCGPYMIFEIQDFFGLLGE